MTLACVLQEDRKSANIPLLTSSLTEKPSQPNSARNDAIRRWSLPLPILSKRPVSCPLLFLSSSPACSFQSRLAEIKSLRLDWTWSFHLPFVWALARTITPTKASRRRSTKGAGPNVARLVGAKTDTFSETRRLAHPLAGQARRCAAASSSARGTVIS
jgi:hypothetical protein